MPDVKGWLFLKIQKKPTAGINFQKASLFVSIPKKIVRRATQRNRIKRLIREAFRQEDRLDPEKAYFFRVMQPPGELSLKEVKVSMNQLISFLKS
jgi:ribonuclease P protein component